jgi:tetratricopeptide (TPR) repeat protein
MNLELSTEQIELHDRLWREGWKIIEAEIHLHNRPPLAKPNWSLRRKLKQAVSRFEQILQINPTNWASMWALGKIYQRMNNDTTALEWFSKAYQINGTNPDVAGEAALCAMNLGKSKEALQFATVANALKPRDAGLRSNLALALLLDHQPDEAKARAEEAVRASPEETVSKHVLRFIDDVIAGRRPYPKNFRDVM